MIKVKTSAIHGKGLFSAKKIHKNTVIGKCKVKKTKKSKSNMYTLWVKDKPYDVKCDLRFINHSSKPNTVYYDDFTVVAIKDIKKGKELLHDYGWDE
ncbi:MAG: SET domain-containing protein [Gammaproteobacteria bacterium]